LRLLTIITASLLFSGLLPAKTKIDPVTLHAGYCNTDLYHVWVYFTDKGSIQNQEFSARVRLTERSLVRRNKVRPNNLVTFRDIPPEPTYIQDVVNTGARLRIISRWLNAVSVAATMDQLTVIANLPSVQKITAVKTAQRKPRPIIDMGRALFKLTRADSMDYGFAKNQIEQINVHTAHANGYFGQDVIVLILDTGFNLNHPVFDSLDIVAEWDFIQKDNFTGNQDGDSNGQHNHGTYTFSAMAGYDPGNLIGPAFGAQFILGKTEIQDQEIELEEDLFVAGLEWGDSLGADVLSSSLGYNDWYDYQDMDGNTAVTTIAVDYAVSVGMVCVTAAGNEANSDWHHIIAPADADSVISVGAVTTSGIIANFSSRGPTYDGRIKPEVCAQGVTTACANSSGEGYITTLGTSMSTPLVAGAAAIILSAHPEWTPMQVREALMMTASQANDPDTVYGYGVIDVWEAIKYTGFGNHNPNGAAAEFQLLPPYPNPFNSTIKLTIQLDQEGYITLDIINLQGQHIETIYKGTIPDKNRTMVWNGSQYPSGIYFARLLYSDRQSVRKLILLK